MKTLKTDSKQKTSSQQMGSFVHELLSSRTRMHVAHLRTTSYPAHIAMEEFYDALVGFADSVAEQYQGATEELLVYPETASLPMIHRPFEAVEHLRDLYEACETVQEYCGYTEIINTVDEIKSLINTTKYKLIFLK